MMMALAGSKQPAGRARARRRDAAARARARTRARSSRSAPATRTASSRWPRRPSSAAGPAPAPAAAASSSARRPRRRSSPRRSGMTLPHAALAPSGQPIWRDMARRSARALVGAGRARTDARATSSPTPSIRNAMVVHAAFGGSTNLLLHIPAIAFAAGLRAADGRRLARGQRQGPAAGRASCPTARSIIRPSAPSWPAACPRSCSTCGRSACSTRSVLTVTGEPLGARARLVGGERAPEAAPRAALRAGRRRSRRRDHEPGPGARAGADQHRHLPARQPRAGGLGHQEHGDRPDASSTPTASIARPARRGSSPASATRSPRSRGRATGRSGRATSSS